MQSSVGRDKSALVRVDIATGKTKVLGASEQADVESVWTDPRTNTRAGLLGELSQARDHRAQPCGQKDVDLLTKELGDGFNVTNRSLDDNYWTVTADDALAPASSYLYDRKAGKVTKLFDQRPALAKAPLVPMQSLEIKARDGLTLVSYLSLPPGSDANGDGVPESPVPMVLNVHGGPWGVTLWLRQRTPVAREPRLCGAGRELPRLHRLRQEVRQRRQQGVGRQDARRPARRRRLGREEEDHRPRTRSRSWAASYGGYATLVGLTFTPECSPAAWTSSGRRISTPCWPRSRRTGRRSSRSSRSASATRAPRRARSCSTSARRSRASDEIKKPLLIGQGANDPRVKQAEADQIVEGDEGQEHARDLRAVPGRRPRLCAPGEPHVVLRRRGRLPGAVPRRPLRADRQRLQGRERSRCSRARSTCPAWSRP